MPNSNKPFSQKSGSSISTVESIGIGSASEASCRLKSILPDGFTNAYDRLYDCVVLVVYCGQHHKVAVTNTRRDHIVWAPFIQLRDGLSWTEGTLDAIQQTIGRQDAEMDAKEAEKVAPKFELEYLELTQIQVPTVNHITRIVQLVRLKPSGFHCCTKSRWLDWIPLKELIEPPKQDHSGHFSAHWGPELRFWCNKVHKRLEKKESIKVLREETLEHALQFYGHDHTDTAEHKALLGIKFKEAHALELYENFLRHCYPSVYMFFESFRLYLTQYKFDQPQTNGASSTNLKHDSRSKTGKEDAKLLPELFKLFRTKKADSMDFQELMIGLVVMDPHCKDHCEARIRFIFRYYAGCSITDGHFTEETFRRMISDVHHGSTVDLNHALKQFDVSSADKVTFAVFYKAIMNDHFDASRLLRFTRSVLSKASPMFGQKTSARSSSSRPTSSRKLSDQLDECFACEKKTYDYAMHAVTLDTTGRCIEPKVINDAWLDESYNPDLRQYSVEYVFSYQSIANVCIDLVRSFHRQKDQPNAVSGLLASKEDEGKEFIPYLLKLCSHLNGILHSESKLIKINAPALVFGDIQGNLNDLLAIEDTAFRAFPNNAECLVWLGNYTGEYTNGVECLVYLFAMKLLAPSKVFLLRGNSETRAQSSNNLRNECFQKYGKVRGNQAFEAFNDIFNKLPVALVLDEKVLCVHSGIMRPGAKLADLAALPKCITDVHKEAPVAYDILTRFPLSYDKVSNESSASGKSLGNHLTGHRVGDLAFHLAPRSTSVTSIDSRSYSEVVLKSSELHSSKSSSKSHSKSSGTAVHKSGSGSLRAKSGHHSPSHSPSHSSGHSSGHSPGHSISHSVGHQPIAYSNSNHSIDNLLHCSGSKKSHLKPHSKSHSKTHDHSPHSIKNNHHSDHHNGHSPKNKSHEKLDEHHNKSHPKSTGHHNLAKCKSTGKTASGKSLHKDSSHSQSHSQSRSQSESRSHSESSTSFASFLSSKGPSQSETFDRKAFLDFMQLNHLQVLIRGSSVCRTGFKVNFKDRCLSVFSCTNVCALGNEAAAVLVTRDSSVGAIRFVSLNLSQSSHSTVSASRSLAKGSSSKSALFHGTH